MLSLHELIGLEKFASRGTKVAVASPAGELTFQELAERVASRMAELGQRGLEQGCSAIVVARHTIATVTDFLALLHLGAFQVPVSAELKSAELMTITSRAGAGWILDDGKVLPSGIEPRRRADRANLGLLSSGSTGTPKLVLRTADHIAAAMQIYSAAVGLAEHDRVLALLPLEHSYGFHNVALATLAMGATVYLLPSPHPRLAMQAIQQHSITLLPAAPVFFELLVKFAGPTSRSLPLRAAVSVGTALSRGIYEQFAHVFGQGIWQSYGTSESGPVALNQRGTFHGELLALGEICPHVSVEILDEAGHRVLDGNIGEIVVHSSAVGLGYEGSDDGVCHFAAGAFHTGDLGFIRDGVLFFAGRKKLLIAAAGHKVDPYEIEQVLRSHPDVSDAAVVGVPDSHGIEQITAFVCTRKGLSHAELLSHCAEHLAAYKVPRVIHFRTKLPRNSMGKLLRDQLR